jgi:hypothetical protein
MQWAWKSPPKLFVLAASASDFTRWRLGLTMPRYGAVHLQDTLVLAGREVSHIVDLIGGLDGADEHARRLIAEVDRLAYSQRLVWCDRRAQLKIARQWWDYSVSGRARMDDSLAGAGEVP